jgi:hypothetical protein
LREQLEVSVAVAGLEDLLETAEERSDAVRWRRRGLGGGGRRQDERTDEYRGPDGHRKRA